MNSVDLLLTNKDITYEIRSEIKRLGRPIPDLIISKTDVGKSRNFNSSLYDRFKWLCGCPKRNKLFCFICLVMGGNPSAWGEVDSKCIVETIIDALWNALNSRLRSEQIGVERNRPRLEPPVTCAVNVTQLELTDDTTLTAKQKHLGKEYMR
ncbi:hypothetical protein NQ318_019249 [Aromia moschata]|uniref:Uncharacterized protein n=1 Tax=Aromia moschata TaxID=1265417 RepID=A0AAV8Z0F9_9CUCU|nr:hypothetical protein NQ318_019249 [Aromia moschata]